VAVAAEKSTGIKDETVSSGRITSSAKSIPAIGELKIAEIPAAAPQAINKVRFLSSKCRIRAIFEPIAEPVDTIGDSNPADPPKPTVKAEAMILEYILVGLIKDDLLLMSYKTPLTPCPNCSRITKRIKNTVSKMPIKGKNALR